MTSRKNCWEVLRCGREPGGDRADELGVCPAAEAEDCDGINSGVKGGRFCWAIAGTLCHGEVQGMFAMKIDTCINCPFLRQVETEEGERFLLHPEQATEDTDQ